MEIRLHNENSPGQPVPSICSCPSCDSLECFSMRYCSGLNKCYCSNCNLTYCRFMSNDNGNDNLIDGKDIVSIDKSVRKDNGYGEITDRIFKDHKERLVINNTSADTTTKTNSFKTPYSASPTNTTSKEPSCSTTCYPLQQHQKTSFHSNTKSTKVREPKKKERKFPPGTGYKIVREKTTFTQTIIKFKDTAVKTGQEENKESRHSSPYTTCCRDSLLNVINDVPPCLTCKLDGKQKKNDTNTSIQKIEDSNDSSSAKKAKVKDSKIFLPDSKDSSSMKTRNAEVSQITKDTKSIKSRTNKDFVEEKNEFKDVPFCTTCETDTKDTKMLRLPSKTNKVAVEEKKEPKDPPSCTTCGAILEQIKDTTNFTTKSYKVVQGGNKIDNSLLPCTTCEAVEEKNNHTCDSSNEKENKSATDRSICTTCQATSKEKKYKTNSVVCDQKSYSSYSAISEPKKNIRVPISCTTCGSVLEQIKDMKNFPTKSCKMVREQNKEAKDDSSCSIRESARESSVIKQDMEGSPIKPSMAKKNYKDARVSPSDEEQDAKNVTSGTSCTSCDAAGEEKRDTNDTSARRPSKQRKDSLSYTTCGAPNMAKENNKDTKTLDKKDFKNVLLCTTCETNESSAGSKDPLFCNICGADLIHDMKIYSTKTHKIVPENNEEANASSCSICESAKKSRSSSKFKANEVRSKTKTPKCQAVFQQKIATSHQQLQKPLNKQDIYNRILEAYKNCNCPVCECIVTLNDAHPPEGNETCNCKPCESVKNTAPTPSTRKKSSVRLPFEESCEDLCNCNPCDCIVCTRQTEKVCSCRPCECLQCLRLSLKYDPKLTEHKDCDCSYCRCEDCPKNNAGLEPVATHEMSTGPDGTQKQCNCALCSYHFCGHQIPDLKNESCECEAQNKFMRKPNASCRHEYDIRTVSVGLWNKANSLEANMYLPKCANPVNTERTPKPNSSQKHNLFNLSTESEYASYSGNSESRVFENADNSFSDQCRDISDQSEELQTRLELEVTANELKSEQNLNITKICTSTSATCECTYSSESIGIQNCSDTREQNWNISSSKQKLSNSKISYDESVLSAEPHKESGVSGLSNNFQIYNIKQYTVKHNSSKLTTSSRNISMGSSKLLQTIIDEICHEILESIVVQATKDDVVKIESCIRPKSITVLKDAKIKSGQVDFSESSLQIVVTDNTIPEDMKKADDVPFIDLTENEDDGLETNEVLFNRKGSKKQPKDRYQDCNFCIIDKGFGNILHYNKHNDREQIPTNSKKCNFDSQYSRYPAVSHATKISRPDFPLKYSWRNTKTWLNNGSQISIHESNNLEYYNNIFELQVYNIRLENTLKKAKTFSMELMKMLHKFEKANKNFKSLSTKFHNIPSELGKDEDEEKSTSKKEERNKPLSLDQPNGKTPPLRKLKTCFKYKNTNKESSVEKEKKYSSKTHGTNIDKGQSSHESSYSECILYNESLDKTLSSPYAIKPRDSKPKIAMGTEHDSEIESLNECFKDAITFETREKLRAFRKQNGQGNTDDHESYDALGKPRQDVISTIKWSSVRKNYYLDDTKPTTKSIGVSVRPIAKTNDLINDDVKSVVVQTNLWDSNMCKKKTYENRALAKLKMEVTQLSNNMPFLQPNVWSNSYDDGISDSKSDLDDISNIPLKPTPTCRKNMWDTLLEDIDYSYTLPPKLKTVRMDPPVRYMTQIKKVDIPYSPKGNLSEHGQPADDKVSQMTVVAPKEDVFKDIKRYKEFLKDLQLKGPKSLPQEKNALDCKNSSCSTLKVGMVAVRRVSNHTAIVKWTAPRNVCCILGYEVLIDGRGVQKILNPTCCMCVVTCLPYTDAVLVTIRTLTSRVAAHAPASTVVYRPRVK